MYVWMYRLVWGREETFWRDIQNMLLNTRIFLHRPEFWWLTASTICLSVTRSSWWAEGVYRKWARMQSWSTLTDPSPSSSGPTAVWVKRTRTMKTMFPVSGYTALRERGVLQLVPSDGGYWVEYAKPSTDCMHDGLPFALPSYEIWV